MSKQPFDLSVQSGSTQGNQYPYPDRTLVGHIKKDSGKIIDRRSRWGNPHRITDKLDRNDVIGKYFATLWQDDRLVNQIGDLQKHDTVLCWCTPHECHGDVLSAFVDAYPITGHNCRVNATLVMSKGDGRWVCRIGHLCNRGYDLYSVVRATLDEYVALRRKSARQETTG